MPTRNNTRGRVAKKTRSPISPRATVVRVLTAYLASSTGGEFGKGGDTYSYGVRVCRMRNNGGRGRGSDRARRGVCKRKNAEQVATPRARCDGFAIFAREFPGIALNSSRKSVRRYAHTSKYQTLIMRACITRWACSSGEEKEGKR